MTKISNKYVKFGILGVAAIITLYVSFVIGEEIAFSNSINSLARELQASYRGQELKTGYIDVVDIKTACALGKKLDLPGQNVGSYENFFVPPRFMDNIEYIKPGPKVAKFVNCDSKEEVLSQVSWKTVYKHSNRLNYEIPFKLNDGYHAIFFYANEDVSSQLPITGVLNIKMDIYEAIEYIEGKAIGGIARAYIKNLNFTHGGIFGTISVMKDGKVISVPEGTKVILEASSNPDAPLQSFAVTNERGEFVLAESIVTLNFYGDYDIREIYPQRHTLKIALPTGEEYLYELDISEDDDNVKLWYMGLVVHPLKVHDGRLVYRVDVVV